MRKLFLICMVVAGLMAMDSCKSKPTAKEVLEEVKKDKEKEKGFIDLDKKVKLVTADDSLSYTLGVANGYGLYQAIESGTHADLQGFDKKDFMKGLVEAFETDTTQKFYDMGLMQGMQMKNALVSFEKQYGLVCDATTAAIALQQALEGDSSRLLIPADQANMVAQTIIQNAGQQKQEEGEELLEKSDVKKLKGLGNLNKAVKLTTTGDSLSYVYGVLNGSSFYQAIEADIYPELKGFDKKDFMKGLVEAFETDTTQKFYDMGLMQGMQMKNALVSFEKQYGLVCDATTAAIALQQALEGDSSRLLIPADQANMVAQMILQAAQMKQQKEEEERLANTPEAKENLAKGEAFLAEKEKEAGVVKTESGLLYKVVKAGEGPMVQADQKVNVSYKGTLIDGTQFEVNENVSFYPRSVVPGFGEGLQLMQKGGEYILYIPADLAYGVRGAGEKIPANSVLVFEVKVLDIQ